MWNPKLLSLVGKRLSTLSFGMYQLSLMAQLFSGTLMSSSFSYWMGKGLGKPDMGNFYRQRPTVSPIISFMLHWLEYNHMTISNWKRAEKYKLSVSPERSWNRFCKVLASLCHNTFSVFSFFYHKIEITYTYKGLRK